MDELGNSESSYFDPHTEPTEQKQERTEEEAANRAGRKQIELIIERLTARITFYDSPKSIDVDLLDHPDIHQKKVMVAQMMVENLTEERDYWITKLPD